VEQIHVFQTVLVFRLTFESRERAEADGAKETQKVVSDQLVNYSSNLSCLASDLLSHKNILCGSAGGWEPLFPHITPAAEWTEAASYRPPPS
jgi:hypothetical protein